MDEDDIVKKSWVIKTVRGVMMVMCPYCGHKENFPNDTCVCGKRLKVPDEPIKKDWW